MHVFGIKSSSVILRQTESIVKDWIVMPKLCQSVFQRTKGKFKQIQHWSLTLNHKWRRHNDNISCTREPLSNYSRTYDLVSSDCNIDLYSKTRTELWCHRAICVLKKNSSCWFLEQSGVKRDAWFLPEDICYKDFRLLYFLVFGSTYWF